MFALLVTVGLSTAQTFHVYEFAPAPAEAFLPMGIAAGPGNTVWFDSLGNLGNLTASGVFVRYLYPSSCLGAGLAAGSDGALWSIGLYCPDGTHDSIIRTTADGLSIAYTLPFVRLDSARGDHNFGIVAGPDGALWFTDPESSHIGRISTSGIITTFQTPAGAWPLAITVGPDGALWFTEEQANRIGRMTTTGALTEFSLPVGNRPIAITSGPDGALWFTEQTGRIGRITTAGLVTEYGSPLPDDCCYYAITTGRDRALWFTGSSGHRLGRITTAGVITDFTVPAGHNPATVAPGPEGDIWFTDSFNRRVGRIVIGDAPVPEDANGDGWLDCADLAVVKSSFGKRSGQPGFDPRADVNRDGVVDVRDLALVSRRLPGYQTCQQ
ncbi:MAG: dockerin type I domain-containing protein [Acidobacteriota bacterium]